MLLGRRTDPGMLAQLGATMLTRLCLIALFLFPLSVAAQAPQPGWIADTKTGCRVWNPSPQPNETISWSGRCPNGAAQGRGVTQWFVAGKPSERHEGEFLDGTLNGRGLSTLSDGSRYEGEFRHSTKNGRGFYSWPSGNRYDGEWRDDKRNGRGVLTLASGARYEGEWRDDRPNGSGTYNQANGETYSGTWTNGCFQQGNRRMWINRSDKECGF